MVMVVPGDSANTGRTRPSCSFKCQLNRGLFRHIGLSGLSQKPQPHRNALSHVLSLIRRRVLAQLLLRLAASIVDIRRGAGELDRAGAAVRRVTA